MNDVQLATYFLAADDYQYGMFEYFEDTGLFTKEEGLLMLEKLLRKYFTPDEMVSRFYTSITSNSSIDDYNKDLLKVYLYHESFENQFLNICYWEEAGDFGSKRLGTAFWD